MKQALRTLILLPCLCLVLALFPADVLAAPEWPANVAIEADGGILMDADTGTILYGKNEDQPYFPASITKILTSLIVLERCDLDEMVTFSHDDVYNVEAGSSSAGIDEGDVLTVRDCLYALMLASANESANALACHVAGSREAFAELMNEKAKSLGCTGSHFNNPSGLNDPDHYTTAHDMALIERAAIQNEEFLEINATRSYKLAPTKRSPEGGYVANHHRMLFKNESVYYPGAFSGKTGYTSLAGNTLVTAATRGDLTLIAVVLNGHQSHYTDTKALFDFGFSNFQSLKAAEFETAYRSLENDMTIGGISGENAISVTLDPAGRVLLPKQAAVSDAVSELSYELDENAPADAFAVVRYTYGGRDVGSVYLRSDGWDAAGVSAGSQNSGADANGQNNGAAENDADANATGRNASQHSDTANANSNAPGAAPSPASEYNSDFAPKSSGFFAIVPLISLPFSPLKLFIGLLVLACVIGLLVLLHLHRKKVEEADLMARRQRRLDRLEDMGFSSSEFDQMVASRRLASSARQASFHKPKGRRTRRPGRRRGGLFRR